VFFTAYLQAEIAFLTMKKIQNGNAAALACATRAESAGACNQAGACGDRLKSVLRAKILQ
jgi:hypothetical protein